MSKFTDDTVMQVIGKNILVLKQTPEYQGLIQQVTSDDNLQAKAMNLGHEVTLVELGDILILNWKKAKNISGDLYIIHEDEVVAILK